VAIIPSWNAFKNFKKKFTFRMPFQNAILIFGMGVFRGLPNSGENNEENDDDEHINIEDLFFYKDDSDETVDSKIKNLIQVSKITNSAFHV